MLPEQFEIEGVAYVVDEYGVVHQDPPVITQSYDKGYVVQRYDSLPDHGRQMSLLRAGYLLGVIKDIDSVLDVGYGNGDFLDTMRLWPSSDIERCGHDISCYPLPEGCSFVSYVDMISREWDLVTYFDSLEHMPDISFMQYMRADHIAITIPYCHADRLGVDWFRAWKHRRPGEHLHHFSKESMQRFMYANGYMLVCSAPIEDMIRVPVNGDENTLTMVFCK